jgi:hypothetical protein
MPESGHPFVTCDPKQEPYSRISQERKFTCASTVTAPSRSVLANVGVHLLAVFPICPDDSATINKWGGIVMQAIGGVKTPSRVYRFFNMAPLGVGNVNTAPNGLLAKKSF